LKPTSTVLIYGSGCRFLIQNRLITHSHGSGSVVRATTQVNGKTGNSTPCHAQTP